MGDLCIKPRTKPDPFADSAPIHPELVTHDSPAAIDPPAHLIGTVWKLIQGGASKVMGESHQQFIVFLTGVTYSVHRNS
jgi:hypothetical protein